MASVNTFLCGRYTRVLLLRYLVGFSQQPYEQVLLPHLMGEDVEAQRGQVIYLPRNWLRSSKTTGDKIYES